ncbi:MAG: YkvA family protein [Proteobacteria bacterium]|nr:YkvA family protein [Pseudomonadota bacterium]
MGSGSWKAKAKTLKREVYALSLAVKDPRVPWYAKAFAVLIIGYALSPIDLIPDFIPVIGYIDDLILIPAGIVLLIKMIPKDVMEECREKAKSRQGGMKGKHWAAASVIVLIWLISIYFIVRIVCRIWL